MKFLIATAFSNTVENLASASKIHRAGNSIASPGATRDIAGIAIDPRVPNTRAFFVHI